MKPAFQLPFKCGQTWRASTYNGHAPDQDSLDLLRFSDGTNVSAGEDVLAAAAGTVVEAHDTATEDPPYGSVITIQHEGDWQSQYVHLDDTLAVKKYDKVQRGQKIATVGGKIAIFGTANAHLHFVQLKAGSAVRCTFNGADTKVYSGAENPDGTYPTENIVSANCKVSPFGPSVSAVSRGPKCLDVFAVGEDGRILTAAWEQPLLDATWRGWWHIRGGKTVKHGKVASISRDTGKLDVFVAGLNGTVYTAAWDENLKDAEWRGWWPIEGVTVPPGSPVGVASRSPTQLDIFAVASDGLVYTAAWDADVQQGKWRGWWNIGGIQAPPGAAISAVSRSATQLDIFIVGNDGRVYTAAWDKNVDQGKWRGWWNIQEGKNCPPGALVSSASRTPTSIDVFVVGNDGRVYTAAWDKNIDQGKWRGWWNIQEGKNCPPGAPATVVSRSANTLDVFVVGSNGLFYAAAWDKNVAQGQWQGWWNVQGGKNCPPGALIGAASRDANKLDVFVVGNDGHVYTAACDRNVDSGNWHGWWQIVP